MKRSFIFYLLVIILHSPVYPQNIVFVPKVDTVKLVGGCTPPEIIFKLYSGTDSDTIKVIARFNTLIFCDDSLGNPIKNSETIGFICSNKKKNDIYELYIHLEPKSQNPPELVLFDSLYYKNLIGVFEIMLKVKRDGIYVDSLSQLFLGISRGLGVEEDSESIPHDIKIIYVYPNPFNPSTKIVYELALRTFVKISVYNSLGELVEVIEQKEKFPGRYELLYEAKNNPSGFYFLVFTTNNYNYAKKIVLLR